MVTLWHRSKPTTHARHDTTRPLPASPSSTIRHSSDQIAITKEIQVFKNLHENAVMFVVADDGMAPYYQEGDYVAGIAYPPDKIPALIGLDCIVQTSDNNFYLRRLKNGSQPDLYNLVCTNINTALFEITLYDQTLVSAAPVIWHRRKIV